MSIAVIIADVAMRRFGTASYADLGRSIARQAAAHGHDVTCLSLGGAPVAASAADAGYRTVAVPAPRVRRGTLTMQGTEQDWTGALADVFPAHCTSIVDCTGPDAMATVLRHANHAANDGRVARTRRTFAENADYEEETQDSLGYCAVPSTAALVKAAAHQAQLSRMMTSLAGYEIDGVRNAAVNPHARTKCWFVTDWRTLDVPNRARNHRAMALPYLGGGTNESWVSYDEVEGLADLVGNLWRTDRLEDWSMLCVPPMVAGGATPGEAPTLRVSVDAMPADFPRAAALMPRHAVAVLAAHRAANAMPVGVDAVAAFVAANLTTRFDRHKNKGPSKAAEELAMEDAEFLETMTRVEEERRAKREEAEAAYTALTRPNEHFLRKRVGVAPAAAPAVGAVDGAREAFRLLAHCMRKE
jgi:hypothetical protein